MNKLLLCKERHVAFSFFFKSAFLILAVLLCLGSELRAQSWTNIPDPLNEDAISAASSSFTSIITVQEVSGGTITSVPYIVYVENTANASTGGPVRVKRNVSGAWTDVGDFSSTNPIVSNAIHPFLYADATGKLYIIYTDGSSPTTANRPAVKTYNKTTGLWEDLGYISDNSDLGVSGSFVKHQPHGMAFDNTNRPYVAYADRGAGSTTADGKLIVKRLNGSSWDLVGTPTIVDQTQLAGAHSINLEIDQTDNTIFVGYMNGSGSTADLKLAHIDATKANDITTNGWTIVTPGSPLSSTPRATLSSRIVAMTLDGNNDPVFVFSWVNNGNRFSSVRYSKSAGTFSSSSLSPQPLPNLGGSATPTFLRVAKGRGGDTYAIAIEGTPDIGVPKVWKLPTGLSPTTSNWQYLTATALESATVDRVSIAIGADNKEYAAYVKGTTASATTWTPRVEVFNAPVTISYSGNGSVCQGGSLELTSSSSVNNQWFKNGVVIDGAINQTYTVTEAGTYLVKLITAAGPPATYNSITSASVPITITPSPTATITAGGSTTISAGGSVVLSANPGTGYTYQWTKDGVDINGAIAIDYTATAAGSYQVKVTSGCTTLSDASVVTVDSTPIPTIAYTGATTFCEGGSLVLTSSATSGNQWKKDGLAITDETNQTYTVTTAGSYTVTTGTTTSTAVNVVVNANPTAAVTASGPLVIGGGGSVVLTANAGTGYTFQWTKDGLDIDGATSADYTASTVGAYRAKVTLGSCTAVSDASNVTDSTPVPTISYTGATTLCQGESLVLTSSAGSGNKWNKDGVAITNATSSTYTVTASGSYTVTTGPTTSTAVNVLVNPNPTAAVTASGSLVVASGGNVVLTANAGTGYTFQWTKDGADINAAINADYTATTGGSYRVKVISNGCITVSDALVVSAATTISYTGNTTFCQGGSLVLTSSASSGNQWYKDGVAINNATSSTYTVNSTGSYTVSAGSTTSTAVNVLVNPSPTAAVTANGSLVISTGGNVLLTANAGTGYTYLWTKDGADINTATNASYTATTAGSYRVRVTLGSCTTLSEASVVTAAPTISFSGATTFCQGGSLVLTSSASSGNQWYNGGAAILNATSSTYTVTSSGSYTVNTGSTHSTAVNIVVNVIPTATITANGPLQFTQGGNVVLSANTGTSFTYQWSKDGTDINAATNATYTATTPGLYRVKVSQSSCTGLSSASTVIYIPTISVTGATTLCQGETVVLTSSASSGNQWFKDGISITGANGATYTAAASGTYSVTSQGSLASSGVNVIVNPLPVSAITAQGPVLFKIGGSVILSGITETGYSYKWFKNGAEINGATDATYTATESGSYTLITTSNGCSVTSSSVDVSSVFALSSTNFGVSVTGESCKTSNDGKIIVTAVQNLNYVATLIKDGTASTFPFTASLQIPNLSAGSYSLCISVVGQASFSQCYNNLVVVEPNDLSIYSSVNEPKQTITLSLNGGKNYTIKVNGVNHTTTKSNITLPLSTGDNKIVVTADSECQGVIEKLVTLNDKVLIYPNPFEDILSLKLINERFTKASIQLNSLAGTMVYLKSFSSAEDMNLELSHLSAGMYLLKLSIDNSDSFYKVIKR